LKSRSRIRWLTNWKLWCFLAAGLIVFATFALNINRFLAVPTQRVEANVLVVEGWIWDYAMESAAEEFKHGGYTLLATSGMPNSPQSGQHQITTADAAVARLQQLGIPLSQIIACPASYTAWNRTASSARAVRDKLLHEGVPLKGINVITVGTHARKTILAYRRIMGSKVEVGIITVPSQNFDSERWWTSRVGIYATSKNTIGWLREYIFGPRS